MVNLPNIITLARLFAVPVVIWLILDGRFAAAFWLFIAAGISDGVDGFLARQFDWRSELGAMLDPIADKMLLVSIYVALGVEGMLPSWLVILVVSRDIMIVGAVLLSWAMDLEVVLDPAMVSKANTAVQIGLAGLVLGAAGFALDAEGAVRIGVIAVALTTLASGLTYLLRWGRGIGMWADAGSPDETSPRENAGGETDGNKGKT